jgi:hypothetical protein
MTADDSQILSALEVLPQKISDKIRTAINSNVSTGKEKKRSPEDKTEISEIDAPAVIQGIKKALVLLHPKSL